MIFSCFTQKLKEKVGGLLGGPKGMLAPLPNYWGGAWPPLFLRLWSDKKNLKRNIVPAGPFIYVFITKHEHDTSNYHKTTLIPECLQSSWDKLSEKRMKFVIFVNIKQTQVHNL